MYENKMIGITEKHSPILADQKTFGLGERITSYSRTTGVHAMWNQPYGRDTLYCCPCSLSLLFFYAGVMGCGAEATGLGFVCVVVINPCVVSQQFFFFS